MEDKYGPEIDYDPGELDSYWTDDGEPWPDDLDEPLSQDEIERMGSEAGLWGV